jgi:DEAD/DEAH box helicase domain-containing protein
LEQIIDDSTLSFAKKCIELNIPQPTSVGYELVNENEEVIGEAELAWVSQKIALLTPEQDESVDAFAKNGWTVVRTEDEEIATLKSALIRS